MGEEKKEWKGPPSAGFLSVYEGRVKKFLNITLNKDVAPGLPRFSVSIEYLQKLLNGEKKTVSIYPIAKKWSKSHELRLVANEREEEEED